MKKRLPVLVYMLGMLPLGYWQHSLRTWLGDWQAFGVVVVYLLVLRLLGFVFVRLWGYKEARGIRMHNLGVEARKQKGRV